jgi:hypothetical protein
MAFYIRISKTHESESSARFDFESDQGRRGVLGLDKLTGEVSLIDPMEGDEKNHYFNRAAVKVGREWRSGRLPDFMEWAS